MPSCMLPLRVSWGTNCTSKGFTRLTRRGIALPTTFTHHDTLGRKSRTSGSVRGCRATGASTRPAPIHDLLAQPCSTVRIPAYPIAPQGWGTGVGQETGIAHSSCATRSFVTWCRERGRPDRIDPVQTFGPLAGEAGLQITSPLPTYAGALSDTQGRRGRPRALDRRNAARGQCSTPFGTQSMRERTLKKHCRCMSRRCRVTSNEATGPVRHGCVISALQFRTDMTRQA